MKNNIKLAVFDVDDTLFDHQRRRIYDSSIEAILKLKKEGIKVAIATGRTQSSIEEKILQVKPDFIIGCNGHEIVDENRSLIYTRTFELKDMEYLYERSLFYKLPMVLKYHDHSYIYEYGDVFPWLDAIRDKLEEFQFKDGIYDRHLTSCPLSVHIMASEDIVDELHQQCPNLKFVNAGDTIYDVLMADTNKSTGIEKILERLELTWEQVFAIGDQLNDVEMVTKAKYGSAVGGAVEGLKEVAKYIALPIEEDGIAKIIEEVILTK